MPTPEPLPTPTSEVPKLPPRPPTMHKGQAGRVAIIAGSRGMSGAAVLCGLGALRGGAGLVRVYTPTSVHPIVAASEPCIMAAPLEESETGQIEPSAALALFADQLSWADVVAVGSGIGQSDEIGKALKSGICPFDRPVILDADGLNVIAGVPNWWADKSNGNLILTPHPGEMDRLRRGARLPPLTGDSDKSRLASAVEFARLTDTTVVLKGHRTVVAMLDRAYVNTTGNPGMAAGGMGDVLTGLIAALIGQGLSPFDAARLGVYAHGAAADRLAKQVGPFGYLAREVADALPAVLADCVATGKTDQ